MISRARLVGLVAGIAGLLALAALAVVLIVLRVLDTHAPIRPTLAVAARFHALRDTPGHAIHVGEHRLACVMCHDVDDGGFRVPPPGVCARCHADVVPTIHAGSTVAAADLDCEACHGFTEDRAFTPNGCQRCHDRPQGTAVAIVLHAKETCATCHRPHETPSLAPKACVTCHPTEEVRHGPRGVDGARACLDCHQVHDTREAAGQRCQACHARTIPKTATSAGGHEACATCHVAHDFRRAATRACASWIG